MKTWLWSIEAMLKRWAMVVLVCNPSAGVMGAETEGFSRSSWPARILYWMRSSERPCLQKQGEWKKSEELQPRLFPCLKKTCAQALITHMNTDLYTNTQIGFTKETSLLEMVVLRDGSLRMGWVYGSRVLMGRISPLPKEALTYSFITSTLKMQE